MGLDGLTSQKWVVLGDGHVVSGPATAYFRHRQACCWQMVRRRLAAMPAISAQSNGTAERCVKRSSLWQRLHHKRWHMSVSPAPMLYRSGHHVDAGWAASAFAYLFDREQRRVLVDFSAMGIPGVSVKVNQHGGAGAFARSKGPGGEIMLARPPGSAAFALKLDIRGLRIDAELDAAPAATDAVGGDSDPERRCQLHAEIRLPARQWAGRMSRQTLRSAWLQCQPRLHQRTAGTPLHGAGHRRIARSWDSIRSGFNGAHENILWLNGRMVPLGAAQFDFDQKQPMQPWHVATDDGLLDLTFEPHGARREPRTC